jgi:hypothetical protein
MQREVSKRCFEKVFKHTKKFLTYDLIIPDTNLFRSQALHHAKDVVSA